jgi:hypothetical protein
LKVPPGIATILNEIDDFGILSVKVLNSVTDVGSENISLGADETLPNVLLLPWV